MISKNLLPTKDEEEIPLKRRNQNKKKKKRLRGNRSYPHCLFRAFLLSAARSFSACCRFLSLGSFDKRFAFLKNTTTTRTFHRPGRILWEITLAVFAIVPRRFNPGLRPDVALLTSWSAFFALTAACRRLVSARVSPRTCPANRALAS